MRNIFEKDPTERDEKRLLALLKQERNEQTRNSRPTMSTFSEAEIMDNGEPTECDTEELLMNPIVLDGMSLNAYKSIYGGDDYGESLPMKKPVLNILRYRNKVDKLKNSYNKYIKRIDYIEESTDEFDPEALEALKKKAKRIKLVILASVLVITTLIAADKFIIEDINDNANEPKDDDSFYEINVGTGASEDVVNAIVKKYNVEKNEIEISNGIAKVPKPKKERRIY